MPATSRRGPAPAKVRRTPGAGRNAPPSSSSTRAEADPRVGAAAAAPVDEIRALADATDALGVALSEAQRAKLLAFCALLRRWNAVYNLTAIRDPAAMLVQHVFDCLAIVPPLRAAPVGGPAGDAAAVSGCGAASDLLGDGAVVLDVGSGGGLPGVVLAICAPGIQVYCVDAVGKKAAFVTQVRAELGLVNLHAIHARAETLQAPRDLPAASLIVSRAFSSLAEFVTLTQHLLAPGGQWAAMKGRLPADEVESLPAPIRVRATIKLAVPRLDAQRHLLLMAA